ncbi:TlpA disulfide reductase family protein [Rhizosphaericola mali]|uniref:AhpC/TSA family protein n=1 Tax=Rhizosphaericola mali TaxID=2545455 RepID=A0A5P2GF45_9BACT|nr:TlpA disulfide reductase family protein [Rhizosphaericola mali]QES90231.1 AhpC/TSA family protein [Rhizosphaericola mali]
MKKKFLVGLALLTTLHIYAQKQQQYIINGNVKDASKVYLSLNANGYMPTDSVVVHNGHFSFKGSLSSTRQASLKIVRPKGNDYFDFFIEPGTININSDEQSNIYADGTPSNDLAYNFEKKPEARDLINTMAPMVDSLNNLSMKLSYIFESKGDSSLEANQLKDEIHKVQKLLGPYSDKYIKLKIKYIADHPQSYYTAVNIVNLLEGQSISRDSAEAFYSHLGKNIQNSFIGRQTYQLLFNQKTGVVGTAGALFSETGIDGKTVSLKDYRGKYVLLDFWASWCGPCRAGNPEMIKQYNQYKSKNFEIIGIAADDNEVSKWKDAVKKDNIGIWKNILEGRDKADQYGNSKDLCILYNIHSFPTKILIDPKGMIIGRYSDDTPLYSQLAEIFK